ncbi:MAG: P-II family nitrogen regulator [Candidatus Aminicenantes bacterium]|nr:P-II family nitrogen regulator [Acidobacteriota bacterium]MCG2812524.1 P-II family nitrogen regulator [Candidatus Aminicenantes bacterium]
MKEIKAIIQPYMLDNVCDALVQIEGLPGLTVSQVLGFGKTRAVDAENAVMENGRAFAKKTKIEVVVPDDMAVSVVDAITRAAHTGKPGDGKIFVCQIAEVVRIRTGERGEKAV